MNTAHSFSPGIEPNGPDVEPNVPALGLTVNAFQKVIAVLLIRVVGFPSLRHAAVTPSHCRHSVNHL